ncbi:MAG: hypothetical protein OEZ58_03335 [Gammaproteobacteria bacterium]|nr:hypothetical protein [Gammaproteobacteria bacterium]MDH5727996.1 hypothetical protein [Gammaproteobacteria bacterium]
MPWWAITYLVIFVLFTIAGIADDLKRPNKVIYIGGETVTAIFVTIFIVGFFQESFGAALGIFVFPMLILGVFHEFMAAKRTMDAEIEDPEFSEKENIYLSNLGLILGNLFIVPGYVFGLMLGLRNVGL